MHHEPDDHDLGLSADLSTLMSRRLALGLVGAAGLATVLGCKSSSSTSSAAATSSTAAATPGAAASSAAASSTADSSAAASGGSCEEIPEETAGPYPGDGSNGPNILTQSGIVRGDIRSSFGSASGIAEGVPLTVKLSILDTGNGCAALSGAAVYLWHCDRDGNYSMYSQGVTDENYLRGVQETDANGLVTFQSIFPACYSGRWPHIHFEVYPSLAKATSTDNKIATSQLAFPKDACDTVYASDGYSTSVRNLAQVSLDSDNIFSDGYGSQLATVAGSVPAGYTATLAVPV